MSSNDPNRPEDESTVGPNSSRKPSHQPLPSTDGLDQTLPVPDNRPAETSGPRLPAQFTEPDHAKLRELFIAACDLPEAERDDFIEENCSDRPELKTELIRLLKSDGDTDGILADGQTTAGIDVQMDDTIVGKMLGPYRILREIGEGGMGSVYEAEQLQPVKRRVALKVIKAGRDSKEVIARFDAERQALAMMDHPTIARIIDAGETELGQPYFAMELVDGVPLTKYCDDRSLGINDRLSLFAQICDGIQHAHQKGIIHRDLKPGNILVTEYDGKPVPKIIDFGLAKALETTHKLTDKTMQTEFGQVLGTVRYMSPEQASLDSIDVDTRSDIYTLGIILYELLTGSTPLETESIQQHAMLQVLELVREKETPRPSSRLSTNKNRLSTITSQRQIEPKRLSQLLIGELDWIVMQSLEKDRDRRYSSASEFADDIHRFLNDEPVVAKPPSTAYRLRKFVRKNRGLVAAAATIAGLLIVGIASTSYFLVQSNRNAARATNNAELERIAKEDAIDQKKLAQTSEKRSADVLKIVSEAFSSVNPDAGSDSTMTARDVLFNAQKSMEQTELDATGKAMLLEILTTSFLGVGEADAAIESARIIVQMHQKEFGEKDQRTLNGLSYLAVAYQLAGRHDEEVAIFEKVLEARKELLGAVHPETVAAMANLGNAYHAVGRLEEAIPLHEMALKIHRDNIGSEDLQITSQLLDGLAAAYLRVDRIDEALKLVEQALSLKVDLSGPEDSKTLVAMNNVALAYQKKERHDEAIALFEETLAIQQRKLGQKHTYALDTSLNLARAYMAARLPNLAIPKFEQLLAIHSEKKEPDDPWMLARSFELATAYRAMGKFGKAIPLLQELLVSQKKTLGPDHSETLKNMSELAAAYQSAGRTKEAIPLYEQALELKKKQLGHDHDYTINAMNGLAELYKEVGKVADAIAMMEKILNVCQEKHGPDSSKSRLLLSNLAVAYQSAGRIDEATEIQEELLEIHKNKWGANNPMTFRMMNNLASTYYAAGKPEKAIPLLEESCNGMRKLLGDTHPFTHNIMQNLATNYSKNKRTDEAIALYREVLVLQKEHRGPIHPDTMSTALALGITLTTQGEYEEAETLLRNVYETRRANPVNEWQVYRAQAKWGIALIGTKQFDEAKVHLTEGFEGLKKHAESIPPLHRASVLEYAASWRLELAKKTENEEDRKKWQAILTELKTTKK